MRPRASHTKSRDGCINCKQRHVKCDETRPTCLRCFRRGDKCIRPPSDPPSSSSSSSSSSQPSCTPQTLQTLQSYEISTLRDFDCSTFTPTEMSALDYFHTHTLPLLRSTQTSTLWEAPTFELMRTSTAFRKILTAIGAQQCALQQSATTGTPTSEQEADTMYGNALHSFRRCSTLAYREKSIILLFGAILLINLEALRGSLTGMLIHASYGTRLALELDKEGHVSDEAEALAWLLRRYCLTLEMFCEFPRGHCVREFGRGRGAEGGGKEGEGGKAGLGARKTTRLFSFLCSSAWAMV